MPVATSESTIDAFDMLCENLNSPSFEGLVGAKGTDVNFLSEVLNGPVIQSMLQAHETLEEGPMDPVSCDNMDLLEDILQDVEKSALTNKKAAELRKILNNPHFKALLLAHDDVGAKNFEESFFDASILNFETPLLPPETFEIIPTQSTDAIKMVGIRKNPDEPLGITVRTEESGHLAIARILAGSVIDRQGLLHVGDIIQEINGHEVKSPDQLMELMKKATGSITLKLLPASTEHSVSSQIYLKSYFNYDPRRDNLIPCQDAGLPFKSGDILQVVNMDDANWWQARKVDDNGPSGLIPSQMLEERRKAFVIPDHDYTHKSLLCGLMTKKKKKMMYSTNKNSELDRTDLLIYEEVARMPPFQRKTLVLIGAQGVGRRTLKQRLIKADPTRFGTTIPHTSRPIRPDEKDGDGYYFVMREDMERNIKLGKYLEDGDFDGHLYGTKYDTLRHVIRSGKMCVQDLSPQALKAVKIPEFMPYVVFVAAPPIEIMRNMHEYARQRGRTDKLKTERDFRTTLEDSEKIERHFQSFFDLTIVNDNIDDAYNKLRKAIETLSTEPQWVPVSWVY